MQEMRVQSLGQEDPLVRKRQPTPVILAWRIPWTEERGGLRRVAQSRACLKWHRTHIHTSNINSFEDQSHQCVTPSYMSRLDCSFTNKEIQCASKNNSIIYYRCRVISTNMSTHNVVRSSDCLILFDLLVFLKVNSGHHFPDSKNGYYEPLSKL